VIQSVVTALQAPDIRRKILFTVFILLIFRILTAVPVPNVDQARLAELFASNQLLALLDIFSGGGLATASVETQARLWARYRELYRATVQSGEAGLQILRNFLALSLPRRSGAKAGLC